MRNAVDNNAILSLTALHDVVFPRVEMAVRLITGSSGNGGNRIVQNRDQEVFTGNAENTPLSPGFRPVSLNS